MSEAAVLSRHHAELTTAGSVLIIDDEAAIRESLETLLEFEGYSVDSAETGEEGLNWPSVPLTWPCLILLFLTATAWKFWRTYAPVIRNWR